MTDGDPLDVVDVTDGRIAALRQDQARRQVLGRADVQARRSGLPPGQRLAGTTGWDQPAGPVMEAAGPVMEAAGSVSPARGPDEVGALRGQGHGTLTVTGLEPRPGHEVARGRAPRALVGALVALDGLAVAAGWAAVPSTGPTGLGAALLLWWCLAAAGHGYDVAGMAWPPGRAVLETSVRFTATSALLLLAVRPAAATGLLLAVPVAVAGSLLLRTLARAVAGRRPQAAVRVLVVGSSGAVERLGDRLAARRPAHRGPAVRVVGRCVTDRGPDLAADVLRRRLTATVRAAGADLVLLADTTAFAEPSLRRLTWTLQASGVGLALAAGPTGVAGHRLRVQAVADDLSVLHVTPPVFTGIRRVLKAVVDRCGALVLLVLLAPLFLLIAAAVRASGPGPVIFRQVRVGRHGERFVMLKFRSMCADAPARRERLEDRNDHGDGVLFKMQADPRVTRVGRVLRRLSLDELPQLVNVLRGEMSLVGPRPALPAEVERYEPDVLRRLLVKPGLTGLWQVSGRSDLDWAESVRLDLGYVENWSLGLDADILVRTLRAVLLGTGAR